MNYNSYPQEYTATITARTSQTMKRVYVNMTLALVVTAFVSLWCAGSEAFLSFIFTNRWAMWALLIAEIGIVLGISAGINKLSNTTATLLFYLFAVINGAALAPIFLVYTGASIAKTFFITAGTFGAMSVYGYFTSSDLSRIGNILIMALFGLIIASVVNIFAHSDTLQWIISIAGVVIFVGLTSMGHPADQTHGRTDAGSRCRPPCRARRSFSLPRLHQSVPVSSPLLRLQP